jgi:hypothetical protein
VRLSQRLRLFVVVILFASWLGLPSRAQSTNATVNGLVLDSSGAVVVGVTVQAINDGTGVIYPTKQTPVEFMRFQTYLRARTTFRWLRPDSRRFSTANQGDHRSAALRHLGGWDRRPCRLEKGRADMGVKALIYFEVVSTLALLIEFAGIHISRAGQASNCLPAQ